MKKLILDDLEVYSFTTSSAISENKVQRTDVEEVGCRKASNAEGC